MDISLLKTFLEVARQKHFGKAAERLFITQSTVSARIKLLESNLELALFDRKRNNIQLTLAGQRLLTHAEIIVSAWERTRQDLSLHPGMTTLLTGMTPDLWDMVGREWTMRVRTRYTEIMLQLEMDALHSLQQRIEQGTLDLAFVFETVVNEQLIMNKIGDVPLCLISHQNGLPLENIFENYIQCDWGSHFNHQHSKLFIDMPPARLKVSSALMAKELLLKQGGTAYLSRASVSTELADGKLFLVAEAPVISRPVYAIYQKEHNHAEQIAELLGSVDKLFRDEFLCDFLS